MNILEGACDDFLHHSGKGENLDLVLVLTVDSIEYADSQVGNKGFEAMISVVELLNLYHELK